MGSLNWSRFAMYGLFASLIFFGVRRLTTPAPRPASVAERRPELRSWDFLGCYDLVIAPWSYERVVRQGGLSIRETADPPEEAVPAMTPPERLRLVADSVDQWGRQLDTYRAVPMAGDYDPSFRDQLRWFVRADTLWLVWSSGAVRGGVALFSSGDSLLGSARSFSRRDSLDATARATARKINCATLEPERRRTAGRR